MSYPARMLQLPVALVLALGIALSGCGCGSHDERGVDEVVTFRGTLVEKENRTLVFDLGGGETMAVNLASGRTWPLDEGAEYLVTAWEADDGSLTARMDGYCSTSSIRNGDGSAIDAGYLTWLGDKLLLFVLWGGGGLAAVIAVWAVVRVARRSMDPV